MRHVAAGLASVIVSAAVASAGAEQRNPFEGDQAAIRIGSTLFAGRCADCHGPDAKGKLGPDLTLRWARGESDESAFLVVRNGVAGSSMPPSTAPDSELWAIVAYLRNISVRPPLESTGGATRSRAALTAAIRDPSAAIAPGFRTVTVSARARERVEGVIKSEDAFSIQVVTASGELRAFAKQG